MIVALPGLCSYLFFDVVSFLLRDSSLRLVTLSFSIQLQLHTERVTTRGGYKYVHFIGHQTSSFHKGIIIIIIIIIKVL